MKNLSTLDTVSPTGGKRRAPEALYREKLRARLRAALNSVATEQSLPLGIRSLIAEELTEMHKALRTETASALLRIAEKTRALAITAATYGEPLLNSATIEHIRIIDLELSSLEEWSAA